jgi:hypothetical protein
MLSVEAWRLSFARDDNILKTIYLALVL